MSAAVPGATASVLASVTGSWALVFSLVGVAALLTVAGLVALVRTRRRTPGGPR